MTNAATTTVLIAGATGTNGKALVHALSDHPNIKPRALVRNIESARKQLGNKIDLVQGDLSDIKSLKRAFVDVQKAYIVTAIQNYTVELFYNFFVAAKEAGVSQLVKFSGLGASVDSPSEVIRQHGLSDQKLIESGLNYTILRPNSFHQNMLLQAQSIAQTDTFYLPLGQAKQSTIDVRDIADITVKVISESGHDNKIYDLTGPESLSFHEVAEIIGDQRGKSVSYVPISAYDARAAMMAQGMPEWTAHVLAEIQDLFATGIYADILPDTEKLLGKRATTFQQFVGSNLSLFQ
ncbi:SDR family oxidoreductase [Marinibactrum halimedae]|uniref:NAD(P)-dependent oxidoreductase n=1 Tax=Marinibactrum halimedae TaxID=1444977 RepID=A0AA37WNH0_9GAMM|nr:SDR family oxidoreductase [Marinibactrum halimedae]MCD9459447.1 SDR family oxidoreductase [Marinibactrum halimedae]GLS27485.1 NAD(P)-dependent oxidoreductase [Marinibactrum halimedae]